MNKIKKPKDISSYVNAFSKEEKKILSELRMVIHSAGKFEETIAYNMPAFRYKTKIVACFQMYAHHVGLYPYSGGIIKKFSKELKKYKTSIGAVQLPKDKKFPKTLIKKIIKARIKEIDQKLRRM